LLYSWKSDNKSTNDFKHDSPKIIYRFFIVPKETQSLVKDLMEKYSTDENKLEMASLYSSVEFDFRHVKRDNTTDQFYTHIDKIENNYFITTEEDVSGYVIETYNKESVLTDYELKTGPKVKASGRMYKKCADNITEGIFSSDYTVCQFSFREEEKGALLKSTVKKTFKNVRYFTSVYFRKHFPIETKEVVFRVPNWIELEFHEINFDGFDIQKMNKVVNEKEQYTE